MTKEDLIRGFKRQRIPEKILKAFEKIERNNFIPKEYRAEAYKDVALPIGYGQTISQPYTISFMLSILELRNNQKILEVGSGSGYVLALINEISKNSELFGIERIRGLAEISRKVLERYNGIKIIYGDGSKGLPEKAPFDRIIVSAAANEIPQKLLQQLSIGGIMVAPVRNSIVKIKKFVNENKIEKYPGFVFVPLVGG
ncbi:MAG: protein-L-isoaspartate(D-aspartate) O-methyltransferase [Nanoarchaeota archaeon]|nr:protein-L-isoaspartate(D-aspartate) O-methyltransferase [Nanoarchaeota archaeon]